MVAVLEPRIRPQRAQERLLEGVLGAVPAEPAVEEPEDLGAVGLVEGLERAGSLLLETYSGAKM